MIESKVMSKQLSQALSAVQSKRLIMQLSQPQIRQMMIFNCTDEKMTGFEINLANKELTTTGFPLDLCN